MIWSTLVLAALAANVAAGPCRPGGLSSNVLSTTIVSSETSQFGTQSETASTGRQSSITESASVTASTTTDAISSTSTAEPVGEAIIFQINPAIRRLSKRDTHFVGNNNPSSCTLASVFRLASGQLFEDGVPIYYTGAAYQELAAQGEPPADAITTTFSIVGGKLEWTNTQFSAAGFCQDETDGKVYITFTSAPSTCIPVSLAAYQVGDCQNGQIAGLETYSTVLSESTESSVQAENLTTSAQTTETTESSIPSTITTSTEVDSSTALTSTTDTEDSSTSSTITTSAETEGSTTTSYSTTQATETSTSNVATSKDSPVISLDAATSTETTTSVPATTTLPYACMQSIGGANGKPPLTSRQSDCSSLYTVTVSPYASTTTLVKRQMAMVIPTAWTFTAEPVVQMLKARSETVLTATTIQPTEIPAYATYCDTPEEYYEACSEAGITGFTTTLPTPTVTEEVKAPGCPTRRMVKRAGEALGFEFDEHWDLAVMPGFRLI